VATFTASDRRLKRNIEIVDDPLTKLKVLKGVYFNWVDTESEVSNPPQSSSTTTPPSSPPPASSFNSTNVPVSDRRVGLMAQDVQSVLPEAVTRIRNGEYLGVDYLSLLPLVIEGLKELDHSIGDERDFQEGIQEDNYDEEDEDEDEKDKKEEKEKEGDEEEEEGEAEGEEGEAEGEGRDNHGSFHSSAIRISVHASLANSSEHEMDGNGEITEALLARLVAVEQTILRLKDESDALDADWSEIREMVWKKHLNS
jgi:hypothetical protein